MGHLHKVYQKESSSCDCFAFVGCYVDEEVSMEYVEDAERLVSWVCKVILMNLQ